MSRFTSLPLVIIPPSLLLPSHSFSVNQREVSFLQMRRAPLVALEGRTQTDLISGHRCSFPCFFLRAIRTGAPTPVPAPTPVVCNTAVCICCVCFSVLLTNVPLPPLLRQRKSGILHVGHCQHHNDLAPSGCLLFEVSCCCHCIRFAFICIVSPLCPNCLDFSCFRWVSLMGCISYVCVCAS